MKFTDKITNIENFQITLKDLRKTGKKIVFSNGCFDILHKGHVMYLSKAAETGDFMVIGLNSDASVKRLKGEKRPVQDQVSRALVMAALEFVNAVILFEEDTPYELIKAIVPDILVKGADYKPQEIVGYDIVTGNGGQVRTIELEEGYSSSLIISKI